MTIEKLNLPLLGGIDLHSDPAAIPDGNWQRLRNLAPRQNGVIGRRASLSFSRELEPSWWHWDAHTWGGETAVAAPAIYYYMWAKYLRPLKFIFDPNYGTISAILITTSDVEIMDFLSGAPSPRVCAAGSLILATFPGLFDDAELGASTPRIYGVYLGEATRTPSLFVFDGITYAIGGSGNGGQVCPHYAGANIAGVTNLAFAFNKNDFGSGNSAFHPDGAAVVRDRVVYFKGPNLYFSDRGDALTVGFTGSTDANGEIVPSTVVPPTGTNYSAIDTRGILVGGEELENITAVAEISTSADGSPVQSVAAAWTANHCYLLLGEPLETTEGGNVIGTLQVNRLNIAAGCVSQSTVCRTPYGTIWCGTDDVWFMPFGQLPIRIGTKLRPYLQGQPAGLLWRLHAEYSDGIYRLAMFKEGQGPNMYDPCGAHFWLNLKNGPPQDANSAQWFGPQEFVQTDCPQYTGAWSGQLGGTFCMARDDRSTGDGRLYALQPYIIRGTVDMTGMSLCSFDTYEATDTTAPQAPSSAPWEASYTVYEGDVFVPTPSSTSLLAPIYKCMTSGITGGTEPNWFAPSAVGKITDGTVVWVTQNYDVNINAHYSAYEPRIAQGGADVSGSNSYSNRIEWSMLSKEFIFGDHTKEKLLDGAEFVATLADSTQLTYNSHPNQDSRSRVWNTDFATALTLGTTTAERYWQRKLLTPTATSRFNALSAQWECAQDSGFVIVLGVNDTWAITVGGVAKTITLTAGHYADIYTLTVALKAAYATATGSTLVTSLDASSYNTVAVFTMKDASNTLSIVTTGALSHLFGFATSQSPVSVAANTIAYGLESPAIALVPDMLLSTINLRYKIFKRGPT